mmetsp:Transcript_102580/g.275514  ORF Transcript_102580/g.275514 Transcript_102580/m.275514 type:complete len:83 (-) Transcript_102580:193-441(-)
MAAGSMNGFEMTWTSCWRYCASAGIVPLCAAVTLCVLRWPRFATSTEAAVAVCLALERKIVPDSVICTLVRHAALQLLSESR